MAAAYLRGHEELDFPRFNYLFDSERLTDLEVATGWFWSIRKERLSSEYINRILSFWGRCVSWTSSLDVPPTKLLSALSRLSCYLQFLTSREKDLLLAVAPYVKDGYNDAFLLEELERLVDSNVAEVSLVMKAYLDSNVPDYDFEDRLKSILTKLAQHGRYEDVVVFAERLRHLPGMIELSTRLTTES